jgi:hypothetical protein
MIQPPQPDEYAPYYGNYIGRVPPGADLFALFATQPDELRALLRNIADADAGQPPKPGEWSIKEVVGHVNDTERIFGYRAACIARGDISPFPGFDQDDYVRGTDFNRRTLADLIEEFAHLRSGNILQFRTITDAESTRRGTASGNPFTPRALLYAMAGHVMHHVESLKVDYHVK